MLSFFLSFCGFAELSERSLDCYVSFGRPPVWRRWSRNINLDLEKCGKVAITVNVREHWRAITMP